MNKIYLSGKIHSRDKDYTHLEVNRTSGTNDILRVKGLSDARKIGETIDFAGYVEVKELIDSKKRKRVELHTKFVKEIKMTDNDRNNNFEIVGRVFNAKARETPLGSKITDFFLGYEFPNGRKIFIPAISWGVVAEKVANLEDATIIHTKGRIQSREYLKNNEIKTAYELSVNRMTPIFERND